MRKHFIFAGGILLTCTFALLLTAGITKEYSSRGGYKDLVDEFYFQAVKQNSRLSNMEDDIEKFYKKKNEATEKFRDFMSYNDRYYRDAKENAATIKDSALLLKANNIIYKSEQLHKNKIKEWQQTLEQLAVREKKLNELHTLLKIMISEPMISSYQKNELPEMNKLKEANEDLFKILEKIREITAY